MKLSNLETWMKVMLRNGSLYIVYRNVSKRELGYPRYPGKIDVLVNLEQNLFIDLNHYDEDMYYNHSTGRNANFDIMKVQIPVGMLSKNVYDEVKWGTIWERENKIE